MRTGVAGLELEVTLSFHDDGTLSGMRSIAADGVALPGPVASMLWRCLRDLKPADALVEAAWEYAEPADDDNAPEHVSGPVGRVLDGISVDAEGKVA